MTTNNMNDTNGNLPAGWRWVKLAEVLSKSDSGTWGEAHNSNGVSVLRSTNFRNDGTLSFEDLTLRDIPLVDRGRKLLVLGDILLERSGGGPKQPVGRVCLFLGHSQPHAFGNFCQRLRANDKLCLPSFLFWHLYFFHLSGRTESYQKQTTGIRNLEYKRYLMHEIPMPPLAEQERIAAKLKEQMATVEQARAAAQARLATIKALPAAFVRQVSPAPGQPLPAGWRWMKLGEVCKVNPRRPVLQRKESDLTSFVPMESIDAITGSVLDMRKRQYGEVKKGYTYFEEGDILFAKITPCMQNGKHFIARNLIDGFGFGTTEFHVIRAGSEIVSELVWHFLRQPQLLIAAKEHFTGAVGQQRLPEDYIRALQFSLPPLAEQERIAAKLREQMAAVEQARAAAEAELATINALPAALLRRAFSGQL